MYTEYKFRLPKIGMTEPEAKKEVDAVEAALDDLAEKVSVAGWKECVAEKIIWIRRIYQIALVVLSICCLYYCCQLIKQYTTRSEYATEIADSADEESLPFSNVTICAQVYFEIDFVKANINIPKKLAMQYTNETGNSLDELYNQLTLYFAFTIRPRDFSNQLLKYFSKVMRSNPQIHDYVQFLMQALPKCEDVLKKCWFNGEEFDCCEKAVQSVDNDGICYLIALNYDSDNAAPSPLTQSQPRPGPSGGLKVEVSLSGLEKFPWLEDTAENGFKVYVNAVPYGDVQSPLGAPHGAETFIKVTPSKRLFSTNCASHNRLSSIRDPLMYYDPEGCSCLYGTFESIIHKWTSCHIPLGYYRPNASTACQPMTTYFMSTFFTRDISSMAEDLKFLASIASNQAKLGKMLSDFENDMKRAMSAKGFCPSHCIYWTYSSRASFVYLEENENRKKNESAMFSKINVYYGDFGYRQYSQVKEATVYLAFCDFGNVVGLYWGMSIISFFHVFWYVPRYYYFLYKSRKGGTKTKTIKVIRSIKVAPANQIEDHRV